MNQPLPGLEETRRCLADHDVVAVVLELPIGGATPVAAMRALGTEASCFLLESVEGSGAVARWSMLGHGPSRVISDTGEGDDPLAVLDRDVASMFTTAGFRRSTTSAKLTIEVTAGAPAA